MERGSLRFYADTPAAQQNKLFAFKVDDMETALDALDRFILEKQFYIRAAWFVSAGEQHSIKLPITGLSEKVQQTNQQNKRDCSVIRRAKLHGKM